MNAKSKNKGTHKEESLLGESGQEFVKVTSHVCPDICVVEKAENRHVAVIKLRELECLVSI